MLSNKLFRARHSRPATVTQSPRRHRRPAFQLLEDRLTLATFVVNDTRDTVDVNPGDGVALDDSGATTLRAAVMEANALFGDDTITLAAGTYTLSLRDDTGGSDDSFGDLDATDSSGRLRVIGAGADITIVDAGAIDRVFDVDFVARLELDGITVRNGRVESAQGAEGGGIRNAGDLSITSSSVIENVALGAGSGGGISSSLRLAIATSTISGNATNTRGGGIWNSGDLEIRNSTISGNIADLEGGGLFSTSSADALIINATVADNSVANPMTNRHGGGLTQETGGALLLVNTLVAGNLHEVTLQSDDVLGAVGDGSSFNLIGDGAGLSGISDGLAGNQIGSASSPIDALLGPLADYGGTTFTHQLLSKSPAIDAGNDGVDLETDQRGFPRSVDGNGDGVATIDVGSFEFEGQGSIHGYKFVDSNGNGTDDGEPRLAGVEIVITGDVDGDGTIEQRTTFSNGADGAYWFVGLFPGLYTIAETPPAGWISTTTTAFDLTVEAGVAWVAESGQAGQNLTERQDARLAFGNFELGAIHGYKFKDTDDSGSDDDEPRLIGWRFDLEGNGDGVADQTTTTDSNGEFSFTGLEPGSYTVREVSEVGWVPTTAEPPTLVIDQSGQSFVARLGQSLPAQPFSGSPALDADGNHDGVVEASDYTVWRDNLSTSRGPADYDGDGETDDVDFDVWKHGFGERANLPQPDQLTPDDDLVEVVSAGSGITVRFEELEPTLAFGNFELGSIHGYKFQDMNGNGVDDDEPRLVGWRFELDVDGDGLADQAALTDSNGEFWFTGLGRGSYTLREVTEAGWVATTVTPPTLVIDQSGQNYVAESGQSMPGPGITMKFEELEPTLAFGNFELGSIHGYKFQDVNGNGVDEDEPRLVGWIFELDVDGDGVADETTLSDSNGEFWFTGLGRGSYTVHEVTEMGWVATTVTPPTLVIDQSGQEYVAESGQSMPNPGITMKFEELEPTLAFGNAILPRISGIKWDDRNRNGFQDQDEPGLSGWSILLTNEQGEVIDRAVTDGEGNFEFAFDGVDFTLERLREILPGTFTLAEVLQDGWEQTSPLGRFDDGVAIPTGTIVGFVTAADLNGDDAADLVVANDYVDPRENRSTLSLLFNDGDGQFAETQINCPDRFEARAQSCSIELSQGSRPQAVVAQDFDGDNDADLAVATIGEPGNPQSESNGVLVFLNRGDGTFPQPDFIKHPSADGPIQIAGGDSDDDGQIDFLVTANFRSDNVSLLSGDGTGNFVPSGSVSVGDMPRAVRVGDLDGRNGPDLAVANYGSGDISLLLGDGSGTFRDGGRISGLGGPTDLALHDLDMDGDLDLVVVDHGSQQVGTYNGNGDGTFNFARNYSVGGGPQSLAVGDLNGDQSPDLAIANADGGSISMLLNMGRGEFAPAINYFPPASNSMGGVSPQSLAAEDLDGDNDLDLAVAHFVGGIAVLMNRQGTYTVRDVDFEDMIDGLDFGNTFIGPSQLLLSGGVAAEDPGVASFGWIPASDVSHDAPDRGEARVKESREAARKELRQSYRVPPVAFLAESNHRSGAWDVALVDLTDESDEPPVNLAAPDKLVNGLVQTRVFDQRIRSPRSADSAGH